MPSISKDEQRAARLREFEASLNHATDAIGALSLVVQGREARANTGDPPLEVAFAVSDDGHAALPAGLWVALRRGDIGTAVELLAAVSDRHVVVGEIETMGSGYRLETVEEKRALPDPALLQARLGAMLDIPADVMGVLAGWGPDDPRTRDEVDALLDSRFGPAPAPASAKSAEFAALSITVDELADVLQLTPKQVKVLATLARRTELTVIGPEE